MINYQELRSSYIKNKSHDCTEQVKFLDNLHEKLANDNKTLVLDAIQAPEIQDYDFFQENYDHLTPLFVEKHADFQDVYCLNRENLTQYKVSVFSQDGIVHDWGSLDDFNEWLIQNLMA